MGEKIGSGAHLSEICRTAVGEFSLQQAWKLDDLGRGCAGRQIQGVPDPARNLLPNSPSANVLPVIEKRVRHGARFTSSSRRSARPRGKSAWFDNGTGMRRTSPTASARLRSPEKLIAIAEAVVPRTYQPIVVFEPLP